MNIKEVSTRAGLPAKTIRYYEDIGLIQPLRAANGYRAFRDKDLHKLVFLSRARALGFTIDDCRTLLALYEDHSRASADVKSVAKAHLARIADKITALRAMEATLADLVSACAGDARPDCPILAGLETGLHADPDLADGVRPNRCAPQIGLKVRT
jgi:MerR family transcriptional regulator, copper efflux regulator